MLQKAYLQKQKDQKTLRGKFVDDKGNFFIFTYYLDSNKQFYSQTVSTNLKDKQKEFMIKEAIFGDWPSREKKRD